MFIFSAKSKKAAIWSSAEGPVSPLNLSKCLRYPSRKIPKTLGRTRATYLACIMGWIAMDDDDDYDDVDKYVGEWVLEGGGECEGGGGSEDLKGILTIRFWTDGVKSSSLYFNNGLE